jgi:hypothetical protein
MKKNTMIQAKFTGLAAIFGLAILVTGCVGDKTVDQYHDDQVQAKLAQLQPIVGSYNGELDSTDGSKLGTMSLRIDTDTIVTNTTDDTGTNRTVAPRGTITYHGVTDATLTFTNAYYNQDTGVFQASIAISTTTAPAGSTSVSTGAATATDTLKLDGSISNGVFTGSIYLEGAEEYGGHFSIVKNAPTASTSSGPSPVSNRATVLDDEKDPISGRRTFPLVDGQATPATMVFNRPTTTPEQDFEAIVSPMALIQVSIVIGTGTAGDVDYSLLFNNAHFDDRYNVLKGEGIITSGTETIATSLTCRRTMNGSHPVWNCTYSGRGGKSMSFVFDTPVTTDGIAQ